MFERLFVIVQHLLPKLALTVFAGWVASKPRGAFTTRTIAWFVRKYGVNMAEAAKPDISSYATFNDFFTRALKPGARPLALAPLVCPVDGSISQFGRIQKDQIFQAKGHHYSTLALLGGDRQLAARFEDGHFACLYLSPRDYHRIHMPATGRIARMLHVPGKLFSVNPTTAQGVPGLFARNERVVCMFEGDAQAGLDPFVMVLVGATIVGSMATVWHGDCKPRLPALWQKQYRDPALTYAQGDEMGRFLLGSTVVLLFPRPPAGKILAFNPAWQPGGNIRMGEAMATFSQKPARQ